MSARPNWILHVRKPHWRLDILRNYLNGFSEGARERIVVHYHPSIADQLGLRGWHASEIQRTKSKHSGARSTSFHNLNDARSNGSNFEYFFCSPVFASLSKTNHQPDEQWVITRESSSFLDKAVALGGIDLSRLAEVRKKGFKNIALLGGVWQSEQPTTAFEKIYDTWLNYDPIV